MVVVICDFVFNVSLLMFISWVLIINVVIWFCVDFSGDSDDLVIIYIVIIIRFLCFKSNYIILV